MNSKHAWIVVVSSNFFSINSAHKFTNFEVLVHPQATQDDKESSKLSKEKPDMMKTGFKNADLKTGKCA